MLRPRGLEPPLVAQLAPQASASTSSAMAAIARAVESASVPRAGASSNKSAPEWQGGVGAGSGLFRMLPLSWHMPQEKPAPLMPSSDAAPGEWRISDGLVPYADAMAFMDTRVARISAGAAPELIWLLEHPPLYTGGTSARAPDLLDARFPGHNRGR